MKRILLTMFLFGTLLSASAQVPGYVPTNGLVGWWPFNGNANDESGNGNNGTVNGATLTKDRFGNDKQSYSFSSSNTYISFNKAPFLNPPFSISQWFYLLDTINMYTTIGLGEVGGNALNKLYISPNLNAKGNPSIGTAGANDITSTTNVHIGKVWVNLVVVVNSYSQNGVKFYVNGNLCGANITGGSNNPFPLSNVGFCVGKHHSAPNPNYFSGTIDDIGMWNRALTQTEVDLLYKGCPNLVLEPSNQSNTINSQAQFTALASDTSASYQWQSNASNMGWSNVPSNSFYSGVTSKKLTVNNINVKNHEQLFRVITTKNTCKDTSLVALLYVNDTCITNVYDTIVTSTTDTLYIKVNTSSLSNPVYNTIKVYPNPSSTQVIIDNGNYSSMGTYTAKIVNALGQQVFQSLITQQQFVIDANTMGGAGIYTLYITDGNNKVIGVKKIVLQ